MRGKKIYIMANFKQRPFILLEHQTFFFFQESLACSQHAEWFYLVCTFCFNDKWFNVVKLRSTSGILKRNEIQKHNKYLQFSLKKNCRSKSKFVKLRSKNSPTFSDKMNLLKQFCDLNVGKNKKKKKNGSFYDLN